MANKGDTIRIILDYTVNGQAISEGEFDEIEFTLGKKQYTLTKHDIVWDSEIEKYVVFASQSDTFAFGVNVPYQLRVRKGIDVGSTNINNMLIGPVISNTII